MNKFLMESKNIKDVTGLVNMNTAAIAGSRVAMAKADRISFVFNLGASAGSTVILRLKQHNAATAGVSKILEIANPYYKKVAAATVFTKVQPVVATSVYDLSADFAAALGLVVLEVLGDQLDTDNGFAWVSVDADISVTAKQISGLAVLGDCRFLPAYSDAV